MFTTLCLIVTAPLAAPLQDPERLDTEAPPAAPAFDPGALASVTDTLLLDEPGDGRVWARGRQYKASFGADGFTYIPFLGSDAPQNYPVTFDVASATVGGDPLPLERASAPSLDGESVTLGRGALDEVYHLTNENVEQTFVFGALPSAGELRVRMDVTTELGVTALGGGFAFTSDLGQVRYGAATAVDADGRTLALEQTWTGSGIEVVVPAEFVATASLPLVIDPVVSTFGVTTDSRRQVDIDTAFDSQNNTYQIVYSEVQSTMDRDVLTVFYNASLDLLVQPSSIDISSAYWDGPRTASAYQEQTFLCVANVGFQVGSRQIRGRTRHAGTGARSAQFDVSTGIGADACDVGGYGNDAASSWDFVVVWQTIDIITQDIDIVAQAVTAQATLSGSLWTIAGGAGDLDRRPSISRSSGRTSVASVNHEYMVVWEREVSPTNHDIWARVIERSGSIIGHPEFRAYSFGDARDPDVSVQSDTTYSGLASQHWAIAFERLLGSDYDVFVVIATDGDADNARNVPDMQNLHDEQRDQLDPSLAFDGQDYLLTYLSEDSTGGFDGYFTAFNVMHQNGELRIGLTERRAALRPEDGETRVVSLASHYDGGGPFGGGLPGDGVAVWIAKDRFGPDDEAGGTVVAEPTFQSVGTQFCTANDNASGVSAWIDVEGSFSVTGNTSLRLVCIDLPLSAFGHFIVSNEEAFTANPAGSAGNLCLTGAIGRYSNFILDSGTTGEVFLDVSLSDIPGPFGSRMAMAGDLWFFQYWTRDVTGGVATSNFSNAAVVYVH